MAYYTTDAPAAPLIVDPVRGGETLDLDVFVLAAAELLTPHGAHLELTASITDGQIEVTWPTGWPFEQEGIHKVLVTVTGTGGTYTLTPVEIVVDEPWSGWYTLDEARSEWPDAPHEDTWLYALLAEARSQVLEYAPTLAEDEQVPANYRRGQLMQARNLWNASKVDAASGGFGEDTFVLRPYPLDWMVKQVLRPKNPRPVIG